MFSIQNQPIPVVNYGNEGEILPGFNFLHSALGAALMKFIPLDPYEFISASGATMFVLNLALALYAFISLRDRSGSTLSHMILVFAVVGGIWLPIWIVTSPPLMAALPLTVAVWYRATDDRRLPSVFGNLTTTLIA
jgi:hypothetical protein